MFRRFVFATIAVVLLTLTGCTAIEKSSIWNSGDLFEWVKAQAIDSGCDPETVSLEDWYVPSEEGNVWRGTCVDKDSGEEVSFAIGVDEVWTPAQTNLITTEALKNASYSGIYDEPITLTDGVWTGEDLGDGAKPTVEFVDGAEVISDLNGDGADDGAVFLMDQGGGTADFTWLAAQLNVGGELADAGSVLIGDRTQVRSVTVQDGIISLEFTVAGPGDAACCASHMVTKTYAVQDGKLVGLGAGDEELVRVSAADLDGTSWSLVEIGEGQPALEDVEVTISFDGDQVSGSAGCNNYNSTFGLAEENPFAISFGPMASTMMACEQPISDQEFAYLTALENATLWGYDYGNLVIAYTDGEGNPDRLLFEPMTNQ